jgi:hypothetical protein
MPASIDQDFSASAGFQNIQHFITLAIAKTIRQPGRELEYAQRNCMGTR